MQQQTRERDAMRPVAIQPGYVDHAEGSCLIEVGRTRVICTATVEERLPGWRRGAGAGWVTAEYGMLPRATRERTAREAAQGKQGGRTQEIQRLIGRSLRGVVDLARLGERTVTVDCDVIYADGGTRCAAITGGWVALYLAGKHLERQGLVKVNPVVEQVAAVSCGIKHGQAFLDLDYALDSSCETDMNFVMTGAGRFVELQGTAEREPFGREDLERMLALAETGVRELFQAQKAAVGGGSAAG